MHLLGQCDNSTAVISGRNLTYNYNGGTTMFQSRQIWSTDMKVYLIMRKRSLQQWQNKTGIMVGNLTFGEIEETDLIKEKFLKQCLNSCLSTFWHHPMEATSGNGVHVSGQRHQIPILYSLWHTINITIIIILSSNIWREILKIFASLHNRNIFRALISSSNLS